MKAISASLALAVGVAVVAAACGGGAEPTAKPAAPAVAPSPTTVLAPQVTPTSPAPPTPTPTRAVAPATPTAVVARYGGVLDVSTSFGGAQWDPHSNPYAANINFGPGLVYSGLLTHVRPQGGQAGSAELIPYTAESWTQPDARTYVFKLRQGVKFGRDLGYPLSSFPAVNGRELTADDVCWSFQRQKGLAGGFLLVAMDACTSVDRHTVKIALNSPDADFLDASIASGRTIFVPKEVLAAKGDLKLGPSVGTGPWIIKSGVAAEGNYEFVKNPDFFLKDKGGSPLPYLDGLRFTRIADEQTRVAAFRAGKLKFQALAKPSWDAVRKDNPGWTYEIRKALEPNYAGIWYNCTIPPFNNEKVRLAAQYATDPWEMIRAVYDGLGWMGGSIVVPDPSWAIPEDEQRRYFGDLNKAKQLLAESGVKTPITFVGLVDSTGGNSPGLAQVWMQDVARVGITMNIQPRDHVTYVTFLNTGDMEAGANLWWTTHTGQTTTNGFLSNILMPGGTITSKTGCTDDRMASLINAQFGEVDPVKRKAALLDVQRYLLEKGFRWGINAISVTGIRPELQGYRASGVGYENTDYMWAWLIP